MILILYQRIECPLWVVDSTGRCNTLKFYVSAGTKRLQRTTTACYVLKSQLHPVRGGLPRS